MVLTSIEGKERGGLALRGARRNFTVSVCHKVPPLRQCKDSPFSFETCWIQDSTARVFLGIDSRVVRLIYMTFVA
jgi:hypothetical protein